MSAPRSSAQEALAKVIRWALPACCDECREDPTGAIWRDADLSADAILASNWLADHVRAKQAEALREAAGDPALRLNGHGGISVRRLRARADRIGGDQ